MWEPVAIGQRDLPHHLLQLLWGTNDGVAGFFQKIYAVRALISALRLQRLSSSVSL